MAWGGQPLTSKVMTQTNRAVSLCKRYSGVPVVAAKVFFQVQQRQRRVLWQWTLMWSPPTWPLAGQSGVWQNALVGSMGSSFQVAIGLATCQDVPGTPFRLPPRPVSRFPGVLPPPGRPGYSGEVAAASSCGAKVEVAGGPPGQRGTWNISGQG